MTREAALSALAKPIYTSELLELDRDFVLKKLQFSEAEWERIMTSAPRAHSEFASDDRLMQGAFRAKRVVRSLFQLA